MLKIKSSRAYNHLHEHEVMALPSPVTIYRYLKKFKPAYGFQPQLFEILKTKSAELTPTEKRGTQILLYVPKC